MEALVTTPGREGSARVERMDEPKPAAGEVLLRTLEIGVCGTDREIAAGEYGVAPDGRDDLILGHEFLGRVERDGHGFSAGDLVAGIVRRGCGHCAACAQGAPDSCFTGDYVERGITRLDGYARELVTDAPEHLVPVPKALGRLGVLAEPASVSARALRHVDAVGSRQPWEPRRALVIGPGAIGMLATYLLRLRDLETVTAGKGRDERADLVEAVGATFSCEAIGDLGEFDIVIEATGDAQAMLDATKALRRNGVACLLGIDGRPHDVTIDAHSIGVDFVLRNRALIGSVNANRVDWEAAVEALARAHERWPDALAGLIGRRVAPDAFQDAFDFRGVKATLEFAAAG
jgi:threonine dehydrogenase-like Zn-dependent dehydrogenase